VGHMHSKDSLLSIRSDTLIRSPSFKHQRIGRYARPPPPRIILHRVRRTPTPDSGTCKDNAAHQRYSGFSPLPQQNCNVSASASATLRALALSPCEFTARTRVLIPSFVPAGITQHGSRLGEPALQPLVLSAVSSLTTSRIRPLGATCFCRARGPCMIISEHSN